MDPLVIRPFRPSDQASACLLFRAGMLEQVRPCFRRALTSGLHVCVLVCLCGAGLLLGSPPAALLLPALWALLLWVCCYFIYAGYAAEHLRTDMRDIGASYGGPDRGFWVAERGGELVGTAAVVVRRSGPAGAAEGELLRVSVSSRCRRSGLGALLTRTALDFCSARGCSAAVLETSSTQEAAIAMYRRLGFDVRRTHTEVEAGAWVVSLTRVTILKMEKQLDGSGEAAGTGKKRA